jgi:hypothetical protein
VDAITEIIYLIQYVSNRRCLIVNGNVLHDDEKPVPDYTWMKALQMAAPLAFVDVENVNSGQYEYVRDKYLRR